MRLFPPQPVFFSFVLLFVILPTPLFAEIPDSTKNDSLKTYHLPEEVVVIGARGEKKLLKLPMAVSVIQSGSFSSSRKTGLNEALQGVPGVFAQSRGGGQDVRLTIRGFGARGNGERSNAATLFGNASGGVVNIESRGRFAESFVENNTTLGSYGLGKNNLALGLTLGSARLLLSGTRTLFDGWREHTNSSSSQLYAIFHSNPDAKTHLKLLGSAAHARFRLAGALTQAQFDADPKQSNPTYQTRDERRFNRSGKLAFNLSRSITDRHTIEVLGYVEPKVLERSERNTFRDFNRYHLGGGAVWGWMAKPDGGGLRISSGLDAGYQDGSTLFYSLINGQRGDSLRSNQREAAGTAGFFAQGEIPFKEKFSVVLGGRFDHHLYISEELATGAQPGTPRNV